MSERIDVDGVSMRLGSGADTVHVIENVDFSVGANELVVLVGPSGCGKTTLLRLVDGLLDPTAGEVRVGGEVVDGSRPDVAMVFQRPTLLPWRTVRENVRFGLDIRGVPADEQRRRADDWLARVGVAEFADNYPHELSGGMQQRVGLARALAVDPDVLLLDEPFGSLDAQTKDRLQTELLQLLADTETTVLFITHDVREAILLGDRVLVLSRKPATVRLEQPIDFERPRWDRRTEIEASEQFEAYRTRIRRVLGLDADDVDAVTPARETERVAGDGGEARPPTETQPTGDPTDHRGE